MRIRDLDKFIQDELTKSNREQVDSQSALILEHLVGISYLANSEDALVSDEQLKWVQQVLNRRCLGEPIQYILGSAYFYGEKFQITPDVLIPRPETEVLLEEAIRWISKSTHKEVMEIWDVGCGSGILAILIQKEFKQTQVWASDISHKALMLAKKNAEKFNIKNIQWIESEFDQQIDLSQKWDLIISNPPYISDEDFDLLPDEIKIFEPDTALKSGPLGMNHIQKIIEISQYRLKPNGRLIFEFGKEEQIETIYEYANQFQFEVKKIIKDLTNRPRVAILAFG